MSRMSATNFFRSKSILVTGASSGIGEELALQLAAAGAHLTLAARRKELLDGLAQKISAAGHETPLVVQADVTRDGDLERAVSEADRAYHKLDIVIANAGFGVVGPFSKLALDDYRRQFETNVFGLLRTLYAALPEIQKSRGNLVLIGSVAGWGATPGASAYAMSKFAVRALANSITAELALDGVKVTLISPGFVDSNIRRIDNRGAFHAEAHEPIPDWLVMPTPTAVRQILRAVARGKREAIITRHGKVLVVIERFAPWIIRAAGRRMAAARGGYRTEPKPH
jgi:short-subunit dehydrogenase